MTPVDLLKASRALITPPVKWNQGDQEKTDSQTGAVSHCSYGALKKAGGFGHIGHIGFSSDFDEALIQEAVKMLSAAIPISRNELAWHASLSQDPVCLVCAYNNQTPHDGVLAWFDQTIAAAEAPQ